MKLMKKNSELGIVKDIITNLHLGVKNVIIGAINVKVLKIMNVLNVMQQLITEN